MDEDIGGVWRTIGGRRVFIKNGQDLATAMKESGKFRQSNVDLTTENEEKIDKIAPEIILHEKEYFACNKVYNCFLKNHNENLLLIDNDNLEFKGEISCSNKNSSVNYSSEQQKILSTSKERSLIAIHNHPGNGTFSLSDIYEVVKNEKLCGIIVVTEKYAYSLKPNFNNTNINTDKEFDTIFVTKLSDANDLMLEKYPNFSNNQLYHLAYKKVFDEMGWEYGRSKR